MNKFIKNEFGNRIKDFSGLKNNNLTAIKYSHTLKKITYWVCECKCGNKKTIKINKVFSKNTTTKSCGLCKVKSQNLAFDSVYSRYIKGALSRNLIFDLSKEDFKSITLKNCFYCGIEPKKIFKTKNSHYVYNGIDRKNNNIGYVIENSLTCCTMCNKSKRDVDYDIFINWIKKLKSFNQEKY